MNGSAATDTEANATARRGPDFWALLERENQRHPGTVQARAAEPAPERPEPCMASRGDDTRVVSYGMPRLGSVPGPEQGGGEAPARMVLTVHREAFTPIGTRIDILA